MKKSTSLNKRKPRMKRRDRYKKKKKKRKRIRKERKEEKKERCNTERKTWEIKIEKGRKDRDNRGTEKKGK